MRWTGWLGMGALVAVLGVGCGDDEAGREAGARRGVCIGGKDSVRDLRSGVQVPADRHSWTPPDADLTPTIERVP